MARLVDADALLLALCDDHNINGANFRRVKKHILDAKCVETAELVYCKDCKHLEIKDFAYGYCKNKMSGIVQPDGFCSNGEKREGN